MVEVGLPLRVLAKEGRMLLEECGMYLPPAVFQRIRGWRKVAPHIVLPLAASVAVWPKTRFFLLRRWLTS